MEVEVFVFAWARDVLGKDRLKVEVPEGVSVQSLLARLAEDHPRLGERLEVLTVAVNQEFVEPDTILRPGDEVALIPPISGGLRGSPFREGRMRSFFGRDLALRGIWMAQRNPGRV